MPVKPQPQQQQEPMSPQEHAAMMAREKKKRQDRQERMGRIAAKSKARRDAYAERGYRELEEDMIPEGNDEEGE
ncbi:hypothetical protein LCGC14_2161130 [marine sediment metagenome]|uniref:Uncharacterized protein n=1 Tax=marine sediment metagenome TaxID=412755 RepID=A0A0F9EF24_9ZZZZ